VAHELMRQGPRDPLNGKGEFNMLERALMAGGDDLTDKIRLPVRVPGGGIVAVRRREDLTG